MKEAPPGLRRLLKEGELAAEADCRACCHSRHEGNLNGGSSRFAPEGHFVF